jgi:hypothetical protein
MVILVAITLCGTGNAQKVSQGTIELDEMWDEVLRIAKGKKDKGKSELEAIAQRKEGVPSVLLARKILFLWDENDKTYYSIAPQHLYNKCIDQDELQQLLPSPAKPTYIYAEVETDARGVPLRATFKSGSDNKILVDAVLRSLKKQYYLPAKPGDSYVPGTVIAQCRIEGH